ncbi:N-formylglutamate amidohydrolase [Thalassovita mangrovi]|uniref:N-formylglutamate amidohydrolase n=1 Tax=Thalassovita mangrovi TaxID=2692236 RepID=A0A6L8LIV9_9RHOB|nr:N-formylglutamate amidohydrolase [Thalassovita mangrovi]MYM55683.1 N-formylglutamate amidohydrolase [Thalassovita mangrovi]
MPQVAFEIVHPDKRSTSVVFASPHSGRDYPASLMKRTVLDRLAIRSSEDAFVDRLFDCAPRFGAPFLMAGAPRAFIDMNRAAEELDPALIEGVRGGGHNPRIASGLGIVPRVVANGRAIYNGKISLAEAQRRINGYWVPYHRQLQKLLDESHARFGEAILIDCHSMPHEALDNIVRSGAPRPDIVLGDRFGASASAEIVDQIEAAFRDAGLRVSRNAPFAGAYTTQHYGRPSRRQHTVQVEIDRSLYMDEKAIRPRDDFAAFRRLLRGVIARIAEIGTQDRQLAAE